MPIFDGRGEVTPYIDSKAISDPEIASLIDFDSNLFVVVSESSRHTLNFLLITLNGSNEM